MVNEQPEALRLAELFEFESDPDSLYRKAADELRRLHEANTELLAALKVAAIAIHEYRTQGAPHAYWDDVEYQAAEAIAKAERTTT